MRRRPFAIVFAVGALAVVGCTDRGSYQVSWQFVGGEPAFSGCGAHGVDSIRITGKDTGGDGDDFTAVCTNRDGQLTQSVPVGTWTFTVHQVDARGVPISVPQLDANGAPILDADGNVTQVPDPTAMAEIVKDQTVQTTPPSVELTPRPTCGDGVDNDGDGRVDLDDPKCAGNPYSSAE